MTHNQRQSELNKQDGQSVGMYLETGIPHEDRYLCRECASLVLESRYNHNMKMCKECHNEATNYGAF